MIILRSATVILLVTLAFASVDGQSSLRRPNLDEGVSLQGEDEEHSPAKIDNADVKKNPKKKEVGMFHHVFQILLKGIPVNTCMRTSDRVCLNEVMKHVMNKNYESVAKQGEFAKVHNLDILELRCGQHEVLFPEPESKLFSENFVRKNFNDDDEDDDDDDDDDFLNDEDSTNSSKNLSKARPKFDEWLRFNRQYYSPFRNDRYDGIVERDYGPLIGAYGSGATGECMPAWLCDHKYDNEPDPDWDDDNLLGVQDKEKKKNKKLPNGGFEATALQEALCNQLVNKCGKYFSHLKKCKVTFPGPKPDPIPDKLKFGDDEQVKAMMMMEDDYEAEVSEW